MTPIIQFTKKDLQRWELENPKRKMRWVRMHDHFQITVLGTKLRVTKNEVVKLANWILQVSTRNGNRSTKSKS